VVPKKAPAGARGRGGGRDRVSERFEADEERGRGRRREGGRTVDALEARARRHVHVEAARAEELDRVDAGEVAPAARHELGLGAVHARARAKVGRVELGVLRARWERMSEVRGRERTGGGEREGTHHLLLALAGEDVALVDEAVQELCARLDDRHVGHAVDLVVLCCAHESRESARRSGAAPRERGEERTGFNVEDHLHGLLVERDEAREARQVEVVLDEVLRGEKPSRERGQVWLARSRRSRCRE